ncbi:MAG: Pathogenesis-related transcriptional factor and ERF protein [Bacteroidia bacterium]|jgi:hypothetical protein
MLVKIPLKNTSETAVVDAEVYDFLVENPYLKKIKFVENLRKHSRGYAFFQKNWPLGEGVYKNETIYLHKLVAEKFVNKPDAQERLLVNIINSNPLDCRKANLEWANRSKVVRNTNKSVNRYGYRGVVKSGKKYRAVIFKNKERFDLGIFDTPIEAARAYNAKSLEFFGKTNGLNQIPD